MTGRIWLITASGLTAIKGDPTANSVLDAAGNTVYEIVSPGNTPQTLTNAKHVTTLSTQDFNKQLATGGSTTYFSLFEQIKAGTFLTGGYGAVLADYEAWGQSAANGFVQQTRQAIAQNAVPWYQAAGNVIRGLGLTAIASPARDLVQALNLYPAGIDAGTIATGIYGKVAPFFDIVDIQCQDDQPSFGAGYTPLTAFQNLFLPCAQQIQAAAPACKIIGGLAVHTSDSSDSASWVTTGPFPAGHLQAMQQASAQYIVANGGSGWWLNFNGVNPAGIATGQAMAGV